MPADDGRIGRLQADCVAGGGQLGLEPSHQGLERGTRGVDDNGLARACAALKSKGYAYQWFDTTEGTHGGLNGNTTFPEGLIWLWKGWKLR
jgi:hypothetical protein